jgi:heat shock protein HslJ
MLSCPEEVAQAEATYLELLETAQTFQVFGQTLVISSEKGTLTYVANRAPLEGTYWRLNTLGAVNNPQAPIEGAEYTALFVRQSGVPSGVIAGTTGCNDYSAVYAANLNEIKVNLPSRTNKPECAPGTTAQEQQYFLALNAATSYRILGDNLQIPYSEGEILNFSAYVPEVTPPPSGGPLTGLNGTRWWLISMGNTGLLPGSEITAEFAINPDGETGTLSGSAGCNTYTTSITGVFQLGPAATTRMFCAEPPGVMEQETAYLAMLETANSFTQAYNQLLIGTGRGVLVYYNAPGQVIPIEPPPGITPELPSTPTPEPVTPEPTTPESPAETETAQPPVAVITAPAEGVVAEVITFDASASTSEAEINSYTWKFGDGATAEGASVQHSYAAPGTYTVTLTVEDANGQIGTATWTITIT